MRYLALIASAIALLFSKTLVIRADETAERQFTALGKPRRAFPATRL